VSVVSFISLVLQYLYVVKLSEEHKKSILRAQVSEITEYHVYLKLAKLVKYKKNKKIFEKIAKDEMKHYKFFKKFTKVDVKPNKLKIFWYLLLSRVFGVVFGLRLMEKGEVFLASEYRKLKRVIPEINTIIKDEVKHESKLIDLIKEEKLMYAGSVVLGLNDALVELTGALAGFTFAFRNPNIIAIAGLVTGIAASLSMAASEYLSVKTDESEKKPSIAALYTGVAYFITILFLIFPFFVLTNVFASLAWTLINATIVILLFTFYISVAKHLNFRRRFLEMFLISMGVALVSFCIGYIIRMLIGIDI
jgi:vacuolar iron transporter family protein